MDKQTDPLIQIIEARVAEQVREQVAGILEDIEQRREAERWNRILNDLAHGEWK
jgi:hypothetical protein